MLNLVISLSVIEKIPDFLKLSKTSATEPLDPNTLPYLTTEKIFFPA